ncbi:DUF547 domain-containing protein [Zobellia roscoffensis]|uniref:DUF547 domain-containing protein n=1 Tax=Zobellia roscoffensis TaxID=2779508 RepID=UPI00188AE9FE|nr:DUF547 domain-containing protein [Zobellia roscoffensis]
MSAITFKYPVILFLLVIWVFPSYGQVDNSKILDLNTFSESFLIKVRNNQDTNKIRTQLYNTTLEELEEGLNTDDKKLAFWINIYNAYIQVVLSENPEKYNDRRTFFSAEQIPIAGRLVSFEKIEHGIIRKSQWKLGLGLVRKWFPNKFERKLRVDDRDYRVHFALNCGAKDCPPVAIYSAEHLNEQLDKGTEKYLKKTSIYNDQTKEVAVTSLFNWFRGDFGCKSGVKDILKEFDIISTTKKIDLKYNNYDWTLDLDNWIDL